MYGGHIAGRRTETDCGFSRRRGMAKVFQCADAGVPCRARIAGDTEEEVLEKAVEHARKKHGVDLTQSSTLANYAQSLIHNAGEPAGRA
jgi:predicted small metal-binding protein